MVSHLSLKVTNKLALFFILAISVIIVIDSSVINFYAYTNKELPVSSKVGIFTIFSITFAIFAIVLLKAIESYDLMSSYKQRKAHNLVRFTALASQFMVIAFLAVEIVQKYALIYDHIQRHKEQAQSKWPIFNLNTIRM